MWFYGKQVDIKKRPPVYELPQNLDTFRQGDLSGLETLNIFKYTRLAILYPRLATLFHRLVPPRDLPEDNLYDLVIGKKLEYMIQHIGTYGPPEGELERMVMLSNHEPPNLRWRLCDYDPEYGARKQGIQYASYQVRKGLRHGCPYIHTVDLKQYMDKLDVKMEDEEPEGTDTPGAGSAADGTEAMKAAEATLSSQEKDEEEAWTVAANLRNQKDMGGGLVEGDDRELRDFAPTATHGRERSTDSENDGSRVGMEPDDVVLAQQGAVLQETAAAVENGD